MQSIKQIEIRVTRLEVAEHQEVYATHVVNVQAAERVCRAFMEGLDSERFLVVAFDAAIKPLAFWEAGRGAAESCMVDPREIFRPAIVSNSTSIVLAHNHPSNNLDPSPSDLNLTDRMVAAGALLGVTVLDHLIITDDSCTSLAELGLIR